MAKMGIVWLSLQSCRDLQTFFSFPHEHDESEFQSTKASGFLRIIAAINQDRRCDDEFWFDESVDRMLRIFNDLISDEGLRLSCAKILTLFVFFLPGNCSS